MTIDRLAIAMWMSAGLLVTSACGDDGGAETQAGSSDSSGDAPESSSTTDDPPPTTSASESSGTESSESSAEASSTDTSAGTSTDTGTDTGSSDTTDGADSSTTVLTVASESSTDSTGNTDELPDIDMTLVATNIQDSTYTETRNFAEDDCALAEACVGAAGQRRLLRFDTITPNVGAADFIVGNPTDNPENFEYGACHMHQHFVGFANYRLLDGDGNVAATGHKQSFALIDLAQFLDDAGPGKYPLNDGTQGITVGWADIYGAVLDCQWIDITGVAAGDYQLEIEINFDQLIVESDYANNLILIDVSIDESDPLPPVVPDEWTCDPNWYGVDDGCDCGCGALDADCANPTVDACQFCGYPGSCNPGDRDCSELQDNNNALCE
jgi:hypothetical protein